jgi:succinoglycan biosynthesis transport protein ExoP
MTNHELNPVGSDTTESFPFSIAGGGGEDDLSLHSIMQTLTRRRWWIVGSIAFCAACAILVIIFMRPIYQSTITIELNKENSDTLDLGDSGLGSLGLGGNDLDTELKTESEVLKSDSLAMAVVQQLNLGVQPPFVDRQHPPLDLRKVKIVSPSDRARLIKIFSSHLKVEIETGTKLIRVSFRSHDPKQAAAVANALIDSYREMYLQTHYAAVSQASEWMTKQLADLKLNVERSEKELADFEMASGILTVPTETTLPNGESVQGSEIHSPVMQKLDALNLELTAAESDRLQKEAIYRLAATNNPDVVLGLATSQLVEGSSASMGTSTGNSQEFNGLQSLEAKRSDLQVQIAQGENIYGPNNRHFKDLQTQLSVVNAQVQKEMKKIVDRAGADLKVAQQTEDAIRARFDAEQTEASKLNGKNVQLSILSQEAFSRKTLYEDLYTKLQEANVSAGMKATNFTVVDPAFQPFRPVLPKKAEFIGFGILIGAFLGISGAYLLDTIDTTIVSLPEIEEITGSAVIAVIPDFSIQSSSMKLGSEKGAQANELTDGGSTAWIVAHPTSAASEAFRSLRTGIFLSRPGGTLKTLLITSSVPAEGKSTVAFNLAVAIAQNGRKVLIVEADMRRPTMKRYMSLKNDIGLSSVLADVAPLDEAIVRGIGNANLDLLPAGPKPPLPSELLSSMKFDSVLEELRSRYDVVVIDSPPALILTDAMAIAAKVDAMVWIVRAGAATRPHLLRAAQQIRRSRLPLIGFVLNGLDRRIDPYGYSYSYYGYNSKRYGAYYGEDSTSDR